MMVHSRMNSTKTVLPIVYLIIGVIVLAILVSSLTVFFYGPSTRETTVVVDRPWRNNYRGWWGYYGAGLPGWGGPKYPPMPSPHPKPGPPPPAPPPPAPAPPAPAPAPPAPPPA